MTNLRESVIPSRDGEELTPAHAGSVQAKRR
jgi:hypothetical protein